MNARENDQHELYRIDTPPRGWPVYSTDEAAEKLYCLAEKLHAEKMRHNGYDQKWREKKTARLGCKIDSVNVLSLRQSAVGEGVRNRVIEAFVRGRSINTIAHNLGLGYGTVKGILRRAFVTKKNRAVLCVEKSGGEKNAG